jgi:hypothetical protein
MPSATTGIIIFDLFVRPFFKIAAKFPLIGFVCVTGLYALVAYFVLKSASQDSDHY